VTGGTSSHVVLVHRLPGDVARGVEEACARAGASAVTSDRRTRERPDAIVAHLPRGARRIPRDVLELSQAAGEMIPLLLVCEEQLVRPATTIRLGAVTLVEHGAHERLYSQLRVLLRAAHASASAPQADASEEAGPHWWYATAGREATAGVTRDESLTMLLPLGACDAAMRDDAHAIVTSGGDDTAPALVERLGHAAGLVHLSREAREWILYWPAGTGALWLFSSQRLPNLSELSRASDVPRFLRGPAAPGEIAFASTRPLGEEDHPIVSAMAHGGPSTLDRLRACGAECNALVVEVR
jgi:hypothetical protein